MIPDVREALRDLIAAVDEEDSYHTLHVAGSEAMLRARAALDAPAGEARDAKCPTCGSASSGRVLCVNDAHVPGHTPDEYLPARCVGCHDSFHATPPAPKGAVEFRLCDAHKGCDIIVGQVCPYCFALDNFQAGNGAALRAMEMMRPTTPSPEGEGDLKAAALKAAREWIEETKATDDDSRSKLLLDFVHGEVRCWWCGRTRNGPGGTDLAGNPCVHTSSCDPKPEGEAVAARERHSEESPYAAKGGRQQASATPHTPSTVADGAPAGSSGQGASGGDSSLREALKWISLQACRHDEGCDSTSACITEKCETCYARAALRALPDAPERGEERT